MSSPFSFDNNFQASLRAAEFRRIFNSAVADPDLLVPESIFAPAIRAADRGFALLGNTSRATGNLLANGIESATSGFGGPVGNFVAGFGGGLAHLSRTAGNVGAALDLPRTIGSTINEVDEAIQLSQQHGFRVGVGQLVGTNQIAQFAVGNDFNGQAVDINTLSEGILKLSGTAGTGAGLARVLRPGAVAPVRGADDLAGSIRNVNPTRGTQNCVNCSIATDATLARHPASALPGNPTSIRFLEKEFGGTFNPVSGQIEIGSTLSRSGNGARGIVFGQSRTPGNPGHVFNAVNQNGTIRFLDGQTGGLGVDNFDNFQNFRFLLTNPGTP